jgi:ribosomal protein S12 methylthiotransferase accessory factor
MNKSLSKDLILLIEKLRKARIASHIERTAVCNDYPKLFQYSVADSNYKERGGGFDFYDKELAIRKAISEFVEVYSLTNVEKNKIFKSNYENLKNKAIPIENLVIPYQDKTQRIKNTITSKDYIYFTQGFDLLRNKKIFIPAHLTYFPIKFKEKKLFREPNSNGAAASTELKKALIKGILELIERDAFLVYYLNGLLGEPLEVDDNPKIKNLITIFKGYNLELYIFYQPTDINVFNITSLAIDKSGLNIIVSVGSCSEFNLENAIIKSLTEVVQILNWGRSIVTFSKKYNSIKNKAKLKLSTFEERAFYWSTQDKLTHVYELINNSFKLRKKPLKTSLLKKKIKKPRSSIEALNYLLENLSKFSMDVYYANITPSKIRKTGIISVKVLIPQLQPMYLSEKFKQINLKRINVLRNVHRTNYLLKINKINPIPHFFF